MECIGHRSARLLVDLGLPEESVVRSLMAEIDLSRHEAIEAVDQARRARNQRVWAPYASSDPGIGSPE